MAFRLFSNEKKTNFRFVYDPTKQPMQGVLLLFPFILMCLFRFLSPFARFQLMVGNFSLSLFSKTNSVPVRNHRDALFPFYRSLFVREIHVLQLSCCIVCIIFRKSVNTNTY